MMTIRQGGVLWASCDERLPPMPRAPTVLIRLMVGGTFLSEGIQKFLFADALGVRRFVTIGIPDPRLTAPFVGVCEVVWGRS